MIEIKRIEASDTWALRLKVMWPNKPLEFVILLNDEEGLHFGIFEKEILVSVISLFVKGNEGHFRKFATDEYFQGRGYGTKLLKHLISEAKKMNLKSLKCNARMTAIEFYQRFGMKVASDIIRKNGKDYIIMELDLEH